MKDLIDQQQRKKTGKEKPESKPNTSPSSFGSKLKAVVLFPVYFVAALIFARNLGK